MDIFAQDGALLWRLLLPLVAFGHILMSPWTKVEESFNVQALHDFLYYSFKVDKFDHLEFPGVVPRTFLGPLCVSVLAKPLQLFLLNFSGLGKVSLLYLCRTILSILTCMAFFVFCKGVERTFGKNAAKLTILLTVTQFHFMFYMSRPLPNTFALIPVLLSFGYLLQGKYFTSVWCAVFATVVFRSELVLLFGPIYLPLLIGRTLPFLKSILHGIAAGTISLVLTIPLDSYFWRKLIWPEGQVWYFNVVLQKSSEWGTQHCLWYFTSALPRALSCSALLIPIGCLSDRRVRIGVLPIFAFLLMYSALGHKELRFVIYAVPALNVVSAVGLRNLWRNSFKSGILAKTVWRLCAIGIIVSCFATTSLFTTCSAHNYPGGQALRSLHKMAVFRRHEPIRVHIDVFSAQTGISRFLHEFDDIWEYNKTEKLRFDEKLAFDYLLIGSDDVPTAEIQFFEQSGFEIVHQEWAFVGLKIPRSVKELILPIKLVPKIVVMQKIKAF